MVQLLLDGTVDESVTTDDIITKSSGAGFECATKAANSHSSDQTDGFGCETKEDSLGKLFEYLSVILSSLEVVVSEDGYPPEDLAFISTEAVSGLITELTADMQTPVSCTKVATWDCGALPDLGILFDYIDVMNAGVEKPDDIQVTDIITFFATIGVTCSSVEGGYQCVFEADTAAAATTAIGDATTTTAIGAATTTTVTTTTTA